MNATGAARLLLKIVVSVGLLAVLVVVAIHQHVMEHIRSVPPMSVAAATGAVAAGWLVNSIRWNLLLRAAGIREPAAWLASLYFIGAFFSQILPTGAGGDAVRMWELYRRGHKPAAGVVATLQERLLGLGVSTLVGLVAGVVYFEKLPPLWRPWLLAAPAAAVIGVSIALYSRILMGKLSTGGGRLRSALRQAAEIPPLKFTRLLPIVAVTLAGVLLSIAAWYLLGRGAQISVGYGGFCLIVPLVWIISMLPSLGGAGVREGGFVLLMGLFGVPKQASLTVAALFLFVQLAVASLGGLLLLGRVLRGSWKPVEPVL